MDDEGEYHGAAAEEGSEILKPVYVMHIISFWLVL